ncbi:MAG TPA: MlaD family protein [Burkholderiales bacterium]|jgi:phospholipid/cholesterol/gamma-HCH transport system substrate-binding protein|nr:MlaD family protein [Burkholderiales bacterium]
MESRSYALLTGLFTMVLGIALAMAFIWFKGDTRLYNDYVVVSKLTVNGLYPQATVRYRGVEVGKVGRVALDEKDPRNILIAVAVERSVPITHGTFAQIGYQGVTGLAYVLLDDDASDPRPLVSPKDNPAQIAVRGNMFDDIVGSSKELLKQASELLDRLNNIASAENQGRLERTLANFEEAAAQLQPALRAIPDVARRAQKLLGDENQEHLRRSLSNLEVATSAIVPVAQDSRQVLVNMRSLSEKLDRISTALSTEITDSTLPRVDDLVEQLTRDSKDFHRLILQVEREPQSLVFGRARPRPGPGEPGFNDGRK